MIQFNKISNIELSEILHKHQLWLTKDQNGKSANFSFRDLKKKDLSYQSLRYANLNHSRFEGTNLNYLRTSFIPALASDLSHVSLRSFDFTGFKFKDAKLCFYHLAFSILNSSHMREGNLTHLNLTFANLMKIDIPNIIGRSYIEKNHQLKIY